jgi:hypothetical protein
LSHRIPAPQFSRAKRVDRSDYRRRWTGQRSVYRYVDIDPVAGQDGGEPGGNILIGFLCRTDRGLTFIDVPGGTATNTVDVVTVMGTGGATDTHLSFSPGRSQADATDPASPHAKAFDSTRKPLVGEFLYNGHDPSSSAITSMVGINPRAS